MSIQLVESYHPEAGPAKAVFLVNEKLPDAGYTGPKSGELAGSTGGAQMPNVPCSYARFKARSDNSGSVYIGTSVAITKADGVTDTTTGFELASGDDTGWIPVDNLNRFWRRTDNAGDDLTYLCL